jgi:hypothetical protein
MIIKITKDIFDLRVMKYFRIRIKPNTNYYVRGFVNIEMENIVIQKKNNSAQQVILDQQEDM